jgi:hypothetical protein
MAILKAIGAFFVKIWRWIKETAWVQPLLIVGAIFAIIFSIPSITKWAGSIGGTAEGAFYKEYQVSLETEKRNDDTVTSTSDADALMNNLYANNKLAYSGNDSGTYSTDINTTKYGEKYFLLFVGSSCSGCKTLEPGFRELRDSWKDLYTPTDSGTFKCYTIFADQTSSNDSSYDSPWNTAFHRFLWNYTGFFNETEGYLSTNSYYTNEKPSDDNYKYYGQPDISGKFVTPAILLVDFTKTAQEQNRAGVSEILFGGLDSLSTKQAKAAYLMQMWNHTDENDNKNPFTKYYNH